MQPSGSGPLRATLPSNEYRQLHHGSPLAEGKTPNMHWRPLVLTPHLQTHPQEQKTSLFPQVSGAVALTVISWPGLLYTFDQKERSLFFETFLRFLGAFRSLNNYKLRMLVGGLYNVDLKVMRGDKKAALFCCNDGRWPSSGGFLTWFPWSTVIGQIQARGRNSNVALSTPRTLWRCFLQLKSNFVIVTEAN